MNGRVEILSFDELRERTGTEPANRDLFSFESQRLYYLSRDRSNTQVVVYAGERIVGATALRVFPNRKEHLCVLTVAVEKGYQGNGFARSMLEAVYAYASERKLKVSPSAFTEDGQCLKAIHNELDG